MQYTNVDKLELHGCQAENWEQNNLQEEKVQVSLLLEVFTSQTGILKGLKKKGKLQRGGGVNDF